MDQGSSLSRHVKKAIQAVKGSGLNYQITPMGTIIESDDLDTIFLCAKSAAMAVREEGSDRISLSLKVDMRFDKEMNMMTKMEALTDQ
jgi:uncharacterized protein (TIGR00106 family)